MSVRARATDQRWLGGGDVDLTVRLRNTGVRPVRVRFVSVLARESTDSFGFGGFETSMDADRNGDPFDRDLLCTEHWLPWRSSATHTVRVHRAGRLPDSLLVVAEVDGEREVIDVDLSHLSPPR